MVDTSMFVKTDLLVVLVHNLAEDTAADTVEVVVVDLVVVAMAPEDMADSEVVLEDVADMVAEDTVAEVMAAVDMAEDIMVVDMLMAVDTGREEEEVVVLVVDNMHLLPRTSLLTPHLPAVIHLPPFMSRMYPLCVLQISNLQLPWSTSNQDLVELFTTIGKVERAEIGFEPSGRSRGIGVVQFDSIETGDSAIQKFQGYMYGGR